MGEILVELTSFLSNPTKTESSQIGRENGQNKFGQNCSYFTFTFLSTRHKCALDNPFSFSCLLLGLTRVLLCCVVLFCFV